MNFSELMNISENKCYYGTVTNRIFMNKVKLSLLGGETRIFLYILGLYRGVQRDCSGTAAYYILYISNSPIISHINIILKYIINQLMNISDKCVPLYIIRHAVPKTKDETNSRHRSVIKSKHDGSCTRSEITRGI